MGPRSAWKRIPTYRSGKPRKSSADDLDNFRVGNFTRNESCPTSPLKNRLRVLWGYACRTTRGPSLVSALRVDGHKALAGNRKNCTFQTGIMSVGQFSREDLSGSYFPSLSSLASPLIAFFSFSVRLILKYFSSASTLCSSFCSCSKISESPPLILLT